MGIDFTASKGRNKQGEVWVKVGFPRGTYEKRVRSHEEGALDSKDTVRKQRKRGIGIRNSSAQEERKLAAVLIHLRPSKEDSSSCTNTFFIRIS